MKKSEIIKECLKVVGAKEVNGIYEVENNKLQTLYTELENNGLGYSIAKNRKDNNLKGIYDEKKKMRYAIIKIVESKEKKVVKSIGYGDSKGKFQFYLIQLKMKNGEEKEVTNINTCADIKVFLKSLNKKDVEYLKIYSMGREVRKSAWIERVA